MTKEEIQNLPAPETDREEGRVVVHNNFSGFVEAEHSRTLEQQRDAWKEAAEELAKQLNIAKHSATELTYNNSEKALSTYDTTLKAIGEMTK